MSLSNVLKEIKKVQTLVEEDVESGPRETLIARRGRKNQAIESFKRLKEQYSNELRTTATFIIVIGDGREEFTQLATENCRCFSTDPESFYKDLVDRIPSTLYLGREGISNIFDIIGRHLEDKMIEFQNVTGYPQLVFRQEYSRAINSREDFLSLVKEALVSQIGGEIVGINAVKNLTDSAINRSHAAQFTPILLSTGDEKFGLTVAKDLERISTKVFIVTAGTTNTHIDSDMNVFNVSELTIENVKQTLKKISNKLKNNQ